MKFGLIIDGCVQRSYFIKDGKSYKLKSDNLEPYSHHHSISNECHLGLWGWPSVFKDGYFINWTEWDELPKLDLDIVQVALEKHPGKYNVDMIRKAYPNAVIVSFIKEATWVNLNPNERLNFFNSCDFITFPWKVDYDSKGILGIKTLESLLKRKVYYMPQPNNINYLHDKFYKEIRPISILNYKSPQRSNLNSFVDIISTKYSVHSFKHIVEYKGPKHNQWEKFLEGISKSSFCFNLDPSPYGGSMGVQCAALGIINFGGIQDSHTILWPDLATNDEIFLDKKFSEVLNDKNLHKKYIKKAFNKVLEVYDYKSIHKSFNRMINNN